MENKEKLIKIMTSDVFKKAIIDCWNHWNRLKRNKMMYNIFTPFYIKWWHKIKGEKPYLELNYEPKI